MNPPEAKTSPARRLWAELLELPRTFMLAFAALAAATVVIHGRAPIGPGQDYHYHLMVAAMNARRASDPIRALYKSINPLDANTLVYTLAFPFEKLEDPIRALQSTLTIFYFIGLPFATLIALRRAGRSPWGALLAFPLAYIPSWAEGGYIPFVTAGPFYVLAIGEYVAVHMSKGKRSWIAVITCAVLCLLTFLAHGHVFAWLGIMLGLLTVALVVRELLALPREPRAAVKSALWVAFKSLLLITPALLACARWYWATHHGDAAATSNLKPITVDAPWGEKMTMSVNALAITLSPHEGRYLVLLFLAALCCMFFARRTRAPSAPPWFELCLLVTVLSIFVFPISFAGGQTVSRRHVDLSLWLLPLVVIEVPRRVRLREAAAIAALLAASTLRLAHLGRFLRLSNREDFKGLATVARFCAKNVDQKGPPLLAYVTTGYESKYWVGPSIHQPHETVAAVCNLDTPVYDAKVYPHNLLPLRYKGDLPAPVTVLSRSTPSSSLFNTFDYVLVQGWDVTPAEATKTLNNADLVIKAGDYQLWRSRVVHH